MAAQSLDSLLPGRAAAPAALVVTNQDAAEALLDRATLRYLGPFVGRRLTASEAARELGVPTNSLLYPLKRLRALSLLDVVGERPRAGRAMRVYAARAEAFYVPFEASRSESLESYLATVARATNDLVTRGVARTLRGLEPRWGVRIARAGDGSLCSQLSASPDRGLEAAPDGPVLLDFAHPNLRLSFPEAKAFQGELTELFARYARRSGGQRYAFRAALCALDEADAP